MAFKIILISLFVLITYYLSLIGMKKTKNLKSFAIGNKDMNPILVGLTMAASISSTATFVINPGFVYTHGFSAYIHYGIAASLGILCAFLLMTKKFLKQGEMHGALTLPDWIYHRYQSRLLSLFFAFINLLSITFIVLILIGCSYLLTSLFGISQTLGLVLILLFVFSYVLIGGTYSHAYTNAFQGLMMIFIALIVFVSGLKYFDGGFFESLQTVSENYASVINTDSDLYFSFFSVFVSGFIITFALMFQPHIFTKVLYLKNEKDVNKFIVTTFISGLVFSLMLFVGFYAKLSGLEGIPQDKIVATFITQEFGDGASAVIALTMLAAGLSTLDGILVAISSMVVRDIYLPFKSEGEKEQVSALNLSRYVLVALGVISLVVAMYPPKLIGLFAQKGVYGLAAASFVPMLFGTLLTRKLSSRLIFISAIIGLFVHLYLNIFGGVTNPAVSATYAILISTAWFGLGLLLDLKFHIFSPKKLGNVSES